MKNRTVITFFLIMLVSCRPAIATGPWSSPTPYDRGFVYVETISSNIQTRMIIGQKAIVRFAFRPFIWSKKNGTFIPWLNNNVAEIRVCFSVTASSYSADGCPQNWEPFQEQKVFTFPIDWVGEHFYVASFQFRDSSGNLIDATDHPITPDLANSNSINTWAGGSTMSISGIYDSKTPIFSLPPELRANIAASQTATVGAQAASNATASATIVFAATHVTGGLKIPGGVNDGGGQTGAKLGSTVSFDVSFYATSPFADVTEMRVLTKGKLEENAWEPYQTKKTFSIYIPGPNFFGLYIEVQYRDALGNISPIYQDWISIEGS